MVWTINSPIGSVNAVTQGFILRLYSYSVLKIVQSNPAPQEAQRSDAVPLALPSLDSRGQKRSTGVKKRLKTSQTFGCDVVDVLLYVRVWSWV